MKIMLATIPESESSRLERCVPHAPCFEEVFDNSGIGCLSPVPHASSYGSTPPQQHFKNPGGHSSCSPGAVCPSWAFTAVLQQGTAASGSRASASPTPVDLWHQQQHRPCCWSKVWDTRKGTTVACSRSISKAKTAIEDRDTSCY